MAEKHQRGIHHVNELGDCLVNVNGEMCSELRLSLSILEELPENTTMCFMYDMCRVETRVSGDMSINRYTLVLFYILETSRSTEGPDKNRHLWHEKRVFWIRRRWANCEGVFSWTWTTTPSSTNCVERSTLITTESSSLTWEVKNSSGRGRKSRLRGTPGFYTLRNTAQTIVEIWL